MSHPSKQKGYRLEAKIDKRFGKKHRSRRIWGSDGRAIEYDQDVDNVIWWFNDPTHPFLVQAKSRKRIADYMQPSDEVDAQIIQGNYREPLVVMRVDKFLELVDEIYGIGLVDGGTVG